jgi:glutaredoxin
VRRFVVAILVFALASVFSQRLPGPFERSGPLRSGPAEAAEPEKSQASPAKEEATPQNEVIVYVTSWCPACRMTTDYLKDKRIPFVVKDIEKNEQYMKEMVRKVGGYRGVPVLDINGRILLGFNPHVLDQLAK